MDLWCEKNLPQIFLTSRDSYVIKYSSILTTTKATKRAVKNSNHCTIRGRSDETRSFYATYNYVTRDATKIEEMYTPTKRKTSEMNE